MNFVEWLTSELDKRDWTASDLARHSGISKGSISNIISGVRQPGNDVCEGIARAFKISPEVVYRRAGLLPPLPEEDINRDELINLYNLMNESNREDVIDYARMKLKKQEKEKKTNANKHDRVAGSVR